MTLPPAPTTRPPGITRKVAPPQQRRLPQLPLRDRTRAATIPKQHTPRVPGTLTKPRARDTRLKVPPEQRGWAEARSRHRLSHQTPLTIFLFSIHAVSSSC